MIKNRDQARELIEESGITCDNVTVHQLIDLQLLINSKMINSGYYRGTYAISPTNDMRFMRCHTNQWEEREAVSFNRDGFIGFAGWASDGHVRPILDAVEEWLNNMKGE